MASRWHRRVPHEDGGGDAVFGSSGFHFGAHAEFLCLSESARIARKPSTLSFEEAAAITDGGLNALWCYKVAGLRRGHSDHTGRYRYRGDENREL